MFKAKINLREDEAAFLERYRAFGYKDKSSMIREALRMFREHKEREALEESARLYEDAYERDSELQALTDSAAEDWPE